MAELEETNLLSNMLVKKPWQLKGEVSASGRPLDSLIDESLGYENAARLRMLILVTAKRYTLLNSYENVTNFDKIITINKLWYNIKVKNIKVK